MTHRYRLMAWDLGNVLSLVDETPAIRWFAERSGRPESDVFDAIFSPAQKAVYESGKITWPEQYEFACGRLKLSMPIGEFTEIFNSSLTPNKPIFPLVEEMLGLVQCGVASNTSEPHWELERARLPFGTKLSPEGVSYRIGAMKPHHEFFAELCAIADVAPEEIVFTDDRPDNVEGAQTLGITALLFRGHEQLRHDLRSLGFEV